MSREAMVALTTTAHGKPIWRVFDRAREGDDLRHADLPDRDVYDPTPVRVLGPYLLDVEVDDASNDDIRDAVDNDPGLTLSLDDPSTWFRGWRGHDYDGW